MLVLPPAAHRHTRRPRAYGSGIPHSNARHTLALPPTGADVSGFFPRRVHPAADPVAAAVPAGGGAAVPTTGGRRGRRDNGLIASAYESVGDVDPRVGEHLLD